jgi:hypothetical protein
VKDSAGLKVGPGNNYFARGSVSVDKEGLRLRARVVDGRLECAEVVLLPEALLGTFRFTIATDLARMSSSLTLGLFLWSDSDELAHREVDIEAGRWGEPRNEARSGKQPTNDMQFVLQPFAVPGNMIRFALGTFRGPSVHTIIWAPGRISFETSNGRRVVQRFSVSRDVPRGGAPHLHINLWNTTRQLANDGLTEVLVTDFSYMPWQ